MTSLKPSRSLPPLIDGDVFGRLVVTVDEVLWTHKCSKQVFVVFQWWGDNESVIIRPVDVSKFPESVKESTGTSVEYNIKTNITLFKTYLKQFNKLNLLLVEEPSQDIVGHVEINNLVDVITNLQQQRYFPITTPTGTRIGDLGVNFNLNMSSKDLTLSDEVTSKKMRKRSRKKNKSIQNSLCSLSGEKIPKETKKGCKTCSEQSKVQSRPDAGESVLSKDTQSSLSCKQLSTSTEPPSSSETDLLKVLEKGKKLRDAMVLSVLEDFSSVDEELFLKLNSEEDNPDGFERRPEPATIKSGEMLTPHEEKLISDYLGGKTMKEEDEIIVLNTLHSDKNCSDQHPKVELSFKNQEPISCSLSAKTNCLQNTLSDKSQAASNNISSFEHSNDDTNLRLFRKINCFRLTVDSINLTSAGWKKINQTVDYKNKNVVDTMPPPGATYFVECSFVEDSPRTSAQHWKTVPLRFCSRRQIENVVYFGQSSAHSLRPPHSLAHTQSQLAAMSCLVCWRHLNQRVPALLGHFSLAEALAQSCLETTLTLPVKANSDIQTVAYIRLTLELGKDKLFFGKVLLEGAENGMQEIKTRSFTSEDRVPKVKELPLDVKDLCGKNKSYFKSNSKKIIDNNINLRTQKIDNFQKSIMNFVEVPQCSNCGQNMLIGSFNQLPQTPFCVSCTNLIEQHQSSQFKSDLNISIPKNTALKEKRHHQFFLGVDTVIGCPLFAAVDEELSCYIDYKFPQITSQLKVEMARSETTSKVVCCEPQPSFSSVHRHTLTLPVVLPLSPLLAAASPGITLRLWMRFYKPTPRDHMVAMALLPMDKLCLMELEFDQSHQKTAISKVFELPLALVQSSVTVPYQQHHNLGAIRLSISYSNYLSHVSVSDECNRAQLLQRLHVDDKQENSEKEVLEHEFKSSIEHQKNINGNITLPHESLEFTPNVRSITSLLEQISIPKVEVYENNVYTSRNKFWTGPFEKVSMENPTVSNCDGIEHVHKQRSNGLVDSFTNNIYSKRYECSPSKDKSQECNWPVKKGDFDILAESLEKKFNKLQSDLMKEKQKSTFTHTTNEVDNIEMNSKNPNISLKSGINEEIFSFQSLSSNSSMESLPFVLGPPADFKDLQNTVGFANHSKPFSDSESIRSAPDTIFGFLREEKEEANLGSNESFGKEKSNFKPIKPKTFKANIKVDRAVNLKAVKAPSNGKKLKVPPSTWVSFGTGDCCEQKCGLGELACSGQRFITHVVRKNYNPIWNLTWDIDLPVSYLLQVDKRLVFWVFEENLDVAFGFASANLSILTSGLPCLSSWLSINDLAGACKGQIKVVITPLEDLSQYQENPVYDVEEDEFEDLQKNKNHQVLDENKKPSFFVASQTEIFLPTESLPDKVDENEKEVKNSSHIKEDCFQDEDATFSADDIISDYKNTLENNFRNEMAGLENLIKFLRVGSMGSDMTFLGATENKENSNPGALQQPTVAPRSTSSRESSERHCEYKSTSNPHPHHKVNHSSCYRDKILIDASTETTNKHEHLSEPSQSVKSSEDILSKLLQQISMFQLPTVKITDNTCQTVPPETKETCTETQTDNCDQPLKNQTVHMKDVSTETEDIENIRSKQQEEKNNSQTHHFCEELGSVLMQHFLTCKPAAVKVTDGACQTDGLESVSAASSSGMFLRSQPSGMSTEIFKDDFPCKSQSSGIVNDWVPSEDAHSNCQRLIAIDNNIKDLENFLKENLILAERDEISLLEVKEESLCGILDSVQASVSENSHPSSDLESLDSYSQILVDPKETPDGGTNQLSVQELNSIDSSNLNLGTLRRQGTFVVEKSKDSPEDTVM